MTSTPLDLRDPQTRLRTLVRARGDSTGAPAIWWLTGRLYAVVQSRVQLLVGFENACVLSLVPRGGSNEGFDLTLSELPFYLDPMTGETLEQFHNPLTGETCTPPTEPNHMPTAPLTAAGLQIPDGFDPALEGHAQVFPAEIAGDNVYLKDDFEARVPGESEDAPRFLSVEQAVHVAKMRDVLDEAQTSIPAQTHLQVVMTLFPWLKMDGVRGHILGQMTGHKLTGIDALPEQTRARVLRRMPGMLDDPAALLKRD